jgi:hypothetical protein
VTDPKKPGRQVLTLKGKGGKDAPKPPDRPAKAPAPKPPPKPKGPAYTPPRALEPYIERFWMVMRSTGRRPQVRHLTLVEAQEEAQRIAANNPGTPIWVIECRTVETVSAPTQAGSS